MPVTTVVHSVTVRDDDGDSLTVERLADSFSHAASVEATDRTTGVVVVNLYADELRTLGESLVAMADTFD